MTDKVQKIKECMFTKDDYTDEDRKVLCDGCEEKCKHDKSDDFTKALAECIHNAQCNVVDPMVFAETWKDELIKLSKCEEPVSEDLEEAAFDYAEACKHDGGEKLLCVEHFKAGANWQKEQMMKEAVKVKISNASIVSLPVNCDLKVGDKVLIIKEDCI